MDKRDGIKSRRPEFCASCSKAMVSYITTVRDFLDKVVEDIDINTPSARREEGVLARTRMAAEAGARDSSDGRKRSFQRTGQIHQVSAPTTQSLTNQPVVKESVAIRDKKSDESNAKSAVEENVLEHDKSYSKSEKYAAQNKVVRNAQSTDVTSSVPVQPSHPQQRPQDSTRPSDNFLRDQQPDHPANYPPSVLPAAISSIDDSSKHLAPVPPATTSSVDDSSKHLPSVPLAATSSVDDSSKHLPSVPLAVISSADDSSKHLPSASHVVAQSSGQIPPVVSTSDRHLQKSSTISHPSKEQFISHPSNKKSPDSAPNEELKSYTVESEPISPIVDNIELSERHVEPKESTPEQEASYEHPPPLYSDHLSTPAQPEQTPLPIEESTLPDGPYPSTWVEDMIRVCDIPLLLPANEEREAYVTMATNNLTAIGCLVLGNSLRLTGTIRTLAVLITDDVTEELRNLLASVFHLVQPISSLEPTGSTKLALLEQPELGINYSKLLVWRLNQFDKCVYLSPDTLVIQNCDELFQRNELSAVPDIGWPDFFNAGVFVYVPSDGTFWDLVSFAENKGSFDGGDQGLLNFYFRNWTLDINKRLPFIFNLMANVSYTYGPAFVRFGGNAKIVHFFGTTKPWNVQFNVLTGQLAPYSGIHPTFSRYVQYWLTIFAQCVLPLFSPDIQKYTTMHGYVNAVDLARIVTGQTESAITFSPPSFRRYLDVPETVAFPAEKVQSILLRRLSIDEEEPPSEEEDEEEEEEEEVEKQEEDKEAEALADLNRMQAWEQGRIDYMGQDSSDNIMKKLDRFIKKGSRLS